jgi:hypothetical protein
VAAPIQYNDMANFPLGVRSFGVPIMGETSGRIFFVDSSNTANKGDDTNHGNTPQAPFATIDFAIGQCSANRGDVIKVLPGHAETITAAAAINLDVAGVTIEGLGAGADRPTITFATSTAASIVLNAASCRLRNLILDMTGIDSIGQGGSGAGGIEIKAADCIVERCKFIIATTGNQIKNAIGMSTGAVRAKILHNEFSGTATAGPNSAIDFYGAGALTVEGIEIGHNRIVGDFATGALYFSCTDVLLNLYVHDNVITATGTSQECIRFASIGAGSSGVVLRNTLLGSNAGVTYQTTATGIANVENYGYDIDTDGLQGTLVPLVGTQLTAETNLLDNILGQEFSWKQANYIKVTADFTSATWNTVASHELLTVTGPCRIIIIPECTTGLTDGGGGTIQLGVEGTTNGLIAATTSADIDTGEFWLTTTPAARYARSSVIDTIVIGLDVGYEIAVAAATGGAIDFHIWVIPLASGATAVAGLGGAL